MASFHSQQQQQNPQYQQQPQVKQNSNSKRLTQEQVRVLERSFSANKKLVPELKSELARQLGVPTRQVAVWYQNKRARWKAQSLEIDHSTLQLKLENAAAEKRRLEREVARLSHELYKAQEMVLALTYSSTACNGGERGPPPPDHHPTSGLYPVNLAGSPIIIDANNNNSCSSSSDHQWGNSDMNDNNNGGGDEVLQLDDDELYASFMMGGGGGSGSTCSWD